MEVLYADYANSMKALANQARLEMVSTSKIQYSASSKKTYKKEVDSLMHKLNDALMNNPKEREAQRRANAEVSAKQRAYKEKIGRDMDAGDVKKIRQSAITKYRNEVGSVSRRDRNIEITDKEWEAIQAGAISENNLKKILNNTDVDKLRERAMPRNKATLSAAQVNRIKRLADSNYTIEEIARKVGISTSAASKYLKGGN
jgi:DNA-binding CsgD family transcriptional regulator